MQSIHSRLYTNVILTAIAILLAILAFQPVFKVATPAQAQRAGLSDRSEDESGSRSTGRNASVYAGDEKVAAATRDLANATREVAEATKEAAEAQKQIATAVGKFMTALTTDTGK